MPARDTIERLSPHEVAERMRQGNALLVCAYDDEEKCNQLRLDGALTLGELKPRASDESDKTFVFY